MFVRLARIFHIREDEGKLVGLLMALSFLTGLPRILGGTAAGTLFLREYNAQLLPLVYICGAMVTPLVGLAFDRLGNHISYGRLLLINLTIQLSSLLGFYLLFIQVDERWPAMIYAIWFQTFWVISGLEFWGLAGQLLNVRQAKRLFALIGAGEVVAMIGVGFLGSTIIDLIAVEGLIISGVVGVAGSIIMTVYMLYRYFEPAEVNRVDRRRDARLETPAPKQPPARRYLLVIAVVAAVAHFTYFFVDNAFITQVEYRFLEDSVRVANFLIVFFAISGVCRLVSQLFMSERVITRFGVRGGLVVLPIMLMFGAGSVVVADLTDATTTTVFLLAVLVTFFDQVFRQSTNRSSMLVLYQPLPGKEGIRAQSFIESAIEPVIGGLAGFVLLVLVNALNFDAIQLYQVMLGVLVVWIGTTFLVGRGYRRMVLSALKSRMSSHDLSFEDGASLRIIQEKLESQSEAEVLYALNVLDTIDHVTINDVLVRLLRHPSSLVKQDALQRIKKRRVKQSLPSVQIIARRESDRMVRSAAIRTLAELAEIEAIDDLVASLHDPRTKLSAMIGLISNCGEEGMLIAGDHLGRMAQSHDSEQRIQAAQVLGEAGVSKFQRHFLTLLVDDDANVRKAAYIAAGKQKHHQSWNLLIPGLVDGQTRGAAIFALTNADASAIADFDAAFDNPDTLPRTLVDLSRIAGRIRDDAMVEFLRKRALFPNLDVRLNVLASLSAQRFRAGDKSGQGKVEQAIHNELESGVWIMAALAEVNGRTETKRLVDALNIELDKTRIRLLYWLSFIYDSQTTLSIIKNFARADGGQHVYALEALDNLLTQEYKMLILPVFDDPQRFTHLRDRFPQPTLGVEGRVLEIIEDTERWITPWLRASAVYTATKLSAEPEYFTQGLISIVGNPVPLLGETALWALHQLSPGSYKLQTREFKPLKASHIVNVRETSSVLRSTIKQINIEIEEGRRMLLTIEKVIILKGVDIFSETAEELLVDIAYQLNSIEFEIGEMIVKKGDTADCMYVIVDGLVKVHDGDYVLAELGSRDFFGELALLDDQPRSASITALEKTQLLLLQRDVFQEIIHDYPEVTRGIMRVLSQRLRGVIDQSAKLQSNNS
jgi:hypothetical protein